MIELANISKLFHPGKHNEVRALSALDLSIPEGQFLIVVGSNGSGKSTMLNVLAGSLRPTTGTVHIGGRNVTALPDYRRSPWIARVFQNPLSGTAPDLSILDNFRLAALRTRRKSLSIGLTEAFRKQVAERIARLGMGLENKLQQPMGSLSGGQRQALTLLMGVMDEVKILLLDEPTAALDPRSAATVMQTAHTLIAEYRLTAVLITHNLRDAFAYGDRVIQMVDGSVARDLEGPAKQSLQVHDLYDWFA